MIQRFILALLIVIVVFSSKAQVTTYFSDNNRIQSKDETAAMYAVQIYPNNTRVTIELIPTKNRRFMNYWSSKNTVLIAGDQEYHILGFIRERNGETVVDTAPFSGDWGWSKVKKGEKYHYTMVFEGKIPPGITTISVVDRGTYEGAHGYGFRNYTINNPPVGRTNHSEYTVKQSINSNNDGICGIYEGFDEQGYKLGVIKENGTYKLIYLGSKEPMSWWAVGDLKATLTPSATPGFFKANWYMANKELNTDAYVVFNGGSLETVVSNEKTGYLKMYPSASTNSNTTIPSSSVEGWSGTGFALKNGYIATNYHVVENSKLIWVRGVNGDFSKKYSAEIIASDKVNDLAIIRISDSNFKGFGTIPYSVSTTMADVGEDIFVLGYPLTSTMGDEIKLTTGVVSSRTGFQGDVSLYQISAPIQPGNSGGPLFDSQGNVIGVVSAKHTGAENVGYAIKASYLRNLMESALSSNILPSSNTLSSFSLANKVKTEKNFVFFIECSSSSLSSNISAPTDVESSEKVYNYPPITSKGDNKLTLISVSISSESTVLELSTNNSSPDGYYQWINISPDAYILANGIKYKLSSADGIALAPNVTYFSSPNDTKTFRLTFPPISLKSTSIDFVESQDSEWKLMGIKLQK